MGQQVRIYVVRWLPLPWIKGMCLPPFGIFIRRGHEARERLLRHEKVHWAQYQQRSVLRYYLGYLYHWVRVGFSYRKHPWEIEARELSR